MIHALRDAAQGFLSARSRSVRAPALMVNACDLYLCRSPPFLLLLNPFCIFVDEHMARAGANQIASKPGWNSAAQQKVKPAHGRTTTLETASRTPCLCGQCPLLATLSLPVFPKVSLLARPGKEPEAHCHPFRQSCPCQTVQTNNSNRHYKVNSCL
jgi:hypothetical protein